MPLEAVAAERDALVATNGRIVGASAEEVAAAVAAVTAVLEHPLMDGARRAERDGLCYRELPVSMLDGDVLLEGVADLAFEVDGAITVVDFKTDRAMAPALDSYVRQVALYAEAISLATGSRPAPSCCRSRRGIARHASGQARRASRASRSRMACSSIARWAEAQASCRSASARVRASRSDARSA